MCIAPITIVRPYRKMNQRYENAAVSVPCGKCVQCLRTRQAHWRFRLEKEMTISESACFLTLTYDNDHLPFSKNLHPTLHRPDLTKFWKRLRHVNKKKIKYYAVGEYGGLYKRPHYHAILYNLDDNLLMRHDRVGDIWNNGNIQIDCANAATIGYVTGYVMQGSWKPDPELEYVDPDTGEVFEDDRIPHYAVMSNKLGWRYFTPEITRYHHNTKRGYLQFPAGQKISMPRYYKDKLFTKAEREAIGVEARELAELNNSLRFTDAIHEIEWKKQQVRKQEHKAKLERQKLGNSRHNGTSHTRALLA